MGLRIDVLDDDSIQKAVDFFNNAKSIDHSSSFQNRNREEFEWAFYSGDYKKAIYAVALDDDSNEIIGTVAAMFIPMRTPEGKVLYTIKPEDVLVSIEGMLKHKGKDILRILFEFIYDRLADSDILFYWGFADVTSTYKRLGYSSIFTSKQGVLTIRPFPAYHHLAGLNPSNRLPQKIQILGLTVLSLAKAILITGRKKNFTCKKVPLGEVKEERMLSFLPSKVYCVHLDYNFLKWRIADNPSLLKYSILEIRDRNGNIRSYLIYSQKHENVFFIEQFLFDQDLAERERKSIVLKAIQFMRKEGAAIIRVMGFKHNEVNRQEKELLIKAGFIFVSRGIPFVFKSIEKGILPEQVYLSRINTQGVF